VKAARAWLIGGLALLGTAAARAEIELDEADLKVRIVPRFTAGDEEAPHESWHRSSADVELVRKSETGTHFREFAVTVWVKVPRRFELESAEPEYLSFTPDRYENERWAFRARILGGSQCLDFRARTPEGRSYPYSLCIDLHDEAESAFEPSGALWYLRPWGLWLQAGAGLVTHAFVNLANGQVVEASQLASRSGVGLWVGDVQLEVHHRQRFKLISSEEVNPVWIEVLGAWGLALPRWGAFVPRLDLMVGVQDYQNEISTPARAFVGAYRSVIFGARARFAYGSRWELGGDLRGSTTGVVTKIFVQADGRFWLRPWAAVGAGAWMDFAQFRNYVLGFNEKTYAGEAYLRLIY
jgi:hypothetical protein